MLQTVARRLDRRDPGDPFQCNGMEQPIPDQGIDVVLLANIAPPAATETMGRMVSALAGVRTKLQGPRRSPACVLLRLTVTRGRA
jgi:hypothetical protein